MAFCGILDVSCSQIASLTVNDSLDLPEYYRLGQTLAILLPEWCMLFVFVGSIARFVTSRLGSQTDKPTRETVWKSAVDTDYLLRWTNGGRVWWIGHAS
jgi:hypothetical protein